MERRCGSWKNARMSAGSFCRRRRAEVALPREVVSARDTGCADAVVLHVLPHPFVGVELGGVTGQGEQLEATIATNLVVILARCVHDKVDRAVGVVQQPFAEVDENACVDGALAR
jgi:hypothetical protein